MAFGMALPKDAPRAKTEEFVVWDENWDAVMMFLRMSTQWEVSMAGYTGMKYEVLVCTGGLFDLYNVKDRRAMLEDLQIMEATALGEIHKEKGNG
jgi:hypothetical protein